MKWVLKSRKRSKRKRTSSKSNDHRSRRAGLQWSKAPDVEKRIKHLVDVVDIEWVVTSRVYCFRSTGTTSRAIARIWGFNRVWQLALDEQPAYCLEVVSERFDKLDRKKKDEVLLHELAHIPKNFSGALVPHTRKRKGSFHDKLEGFLVAYNRKA